MVFLWNADFSRRAKISIGAILMLGSVACVCTIIRIGWIHYLVLPTNAYIVTAQGITLLSGIELSIGLICISLATYKPLFKRFLEHTRFYSGSRYGNDSEGRSHTLASFQSQHGVPEQARDIEQVPPRHPLHSAHIPSEYVYEQRNEKSGISPASPSHTAQSRSTDWGSKCWYDTPSSDARSRCSDEYHGGRAV